MFPGLLSRADPPVTTTLMYLLASHLTDGFILVYPLQMACCAVLQSI